MTDNEQGRPLTRRELRLRAQAAEAEAQQHSAPSSEEEALVDPPSVDRSAAEELVAEIEISPFNEDGTPRSRREIRLLREAAIAELLGSEEQSTVEAGETESVEDETEDSGTPTEAYTFDEIRDAESIAGEPTEAMSLKEIREAESTLAETEPLSLEDLLGEEVDDEPAENRESIAALFDEDDEAHEAEPVSVDESPDESDDAAETEEETDAVDFVFPEAEVTASNVDDAAEVAEVEDEPDAAPQDAEEDSSEDLEAEAEAEAVPFAPVSAFDGEPDAQAAGQVNDDAPQADDAESQPNGADDTASSGYSFPDIQPPEEWRSVFDDPTRSVETSEESAGGFDDLISRAVAQEGSTGSTGASALILPSHPEDTGGLSGPLGMTGELFVTGSIELPKAIGETGGHSATHDSVELPPFLTGEQPGALSQAPDAGPVPVSARSAVSARRRPEVPVVAEPVKDRSKLPIVLALTGGGLLVLLVGGVVYAFSQGLFN